MNRLKRAMRSPTLRPYLLCVVVTLAGVLLDGGQGRFLTVGIATSVMQQFATVGPVALAVGLTMIAGEFDLSVGGMTSLAGCVAVLFGVASPILGVLAAGVMGLAAGLIQGLMITRLRLSSVAVTLGGLLTLSGIAYVITDNTTLGYARMDVAMLVNAPQFGIISIRSFAALLMFAVAALVMGFTRVGRDLVAVGSDRQAANVAGVSVAWLVAGVFAVSGVLAACSGALLSYSIAAASPAAIANTLIPAVAAAIIGGVSLSGGRGTVVGIAGGVLVLAILRTSMSSVGLPPFAQDVITGVVLVLVALVDSEDGAKRIYALGMRRSPADRIGGGP